ncbi:unnamed protein product [Pieris brassicae]|uniref:Uncharacterized protein n=1 Tax=Pieris brassicae TaxID=7116 RepID=A0A9P0T376_PIEBR|nr:unnamed protein product [Pieris brassicae]
MDCYTLVLLASLLVITEAWSSPYHAVRPMRVTRYAQIPHRIPIPSLPMRHLNWNRPKRGQHHEVDHDYDRDHDYARDHDYNRDHDYDSHKGVTGPVHTFVKTDKNANYKWGVRHHVGNKYAS